MHLLAALEEVLWRIDMTARVQPHVYAAHYLAQAFVGVVGFHQVELELHIKLEALQNLQSTTRVADQ